LLIMRRGGTRLVQDPIDQFDVSREPLAVLLRLGSLATVPSELQLQGQQLAQQQRRPLRLQDLGQVILDPRPPSFPPGGLVAIAALNHVLELRERPTIVVRWPGPAHDALSQRMRINWSLLATVLRAQPSCAAISSRVWPSIFSRAMRRSVSSPRLSSSRLYCSATRAANEGVGSEPTMASRPARSPPGPGPSRAASSRMRRPPPRFCRP